MVWFSKANLHRKDIATTLHLCCTLVREFHDHRGNIYKLALDESIYVRLGIRAYCGGRFGCCL